MKKTIITSVMLIFTSVLSYSQTGQKWSANGNAASIGDFIGTTNNEPLILKSNNIVGLRLKPNGQLIIKSLDLNSSAPSGLVLTSGQGEISRLDFNTNSNQVLYSNGSWGNLPIIPAPNWIESNGTLSYTHGNVGIGTTNPLFSLDIIGDARVSNNLYVGGGIVISDKISAITEVKGWDFKVDNDINIEGSSRLKGATRLDQGFTFDGIKGINYTPASNGSSAKFHYGNKVLGIPESCAAGPQAWANHQFGGMLQIYDADPNTGQYISNSGLLNFQTWSGGSSIDASIGGQSNGANLLLNYFCGNNVGICNGQYGGNVGICNGQNGIVSMGKFVEIGMPTTDNLVALNIKTNNGQTIGLQIKDENNLKNFVVKTDGYVYARAIEISINNFPDYVFNKNYKLTPLKEVEKFILKNKHLQGFESGKTYEEKGLSVGDILKLQQEKIEELTLYLIEQNKKIEALENQINH